MAQTHLAKARADHLWHIGTRDRLLPFTLSPATRATRSLSDGSITPAARTSSEATNTLDDLVRTILRQRQVSRVETDLETDKCRKLVRTKTGMLAYARVCACLDAVTDETGVSEETRAMADYARRMLTLTLFGTAQQAAAYIPSHSHDSNPHGRFETDSNGMSYDLCGMEADVDGDVGEWCPPSSPPPAPLDEPLFVIHPDGATIALRAHLVDTDAPLEKEEEEDEYALIEI